MWVIRYKIYNQYPQEFWLTYKKEANYIAKEFKKLKHISCVEVVKAGEQLAITLLLASP